MPNYRYWCFTAYKEPKIITTDIGGWPEGTCDKNIRYAIYQQEKCPTTDKIHWQGYFETKEPVSMKWIKTALDDNTIHLEQRKGTQEQAIDYCKKLESAVPGSLMEYGTKGSPGLRSDLISVQESLKSGATMKEVAEQNFEAFCKYHRAFEKYRTLCMTRRNWMTELHIYWGEAGTGKSLKAFEENPDAYVLRRSNGGTVWWDGYDQHEVIIIDDFYGWIPYDLLLRLADRYPLLIDTKGGAVEFIAKKIIITSNTPPNEWYPNISCNPIRWKALERRITECIRFQGTGNEVAGNTDRNLDPFEDADSELEELMSVTPSRVRQ